MRRSAGREPVPMSHRQISRGGMVWTLANHRARQLFFVLAFRYLMKSILFALVILCERLALEEGMRDDGTAALLNVIKHG